MFRLDLTFWKTKFTAWLRNLRIKLHLGRAGSRISGGFEEELEKTMRGFAKDNLGIEVDASVFSG